MPVLLLCPCVSLGSGAEEYEPDHTEDQNREAGGDEEESEHRRPTLGLPRFGWRFNDVVLLLCCHDALGSLMLRQGRRCVRRCVPGATRDFR